jgi:hypothetical protein
LQGAGIAHSDFRKATEAQTPLGRIGEPDDIAPAAVFFASSDSAWITGETPAQQLAPVIPWLAENEGASRWYLIGNDYNWPRDTNAAAKEIIADAGGEVVGEEYVPLGSSDFDASCSASVPPAPMPCW